MTCRLILARHGDTGPECENRYLGSTDMPLSEHGMRQAEALARKLEALTPDHIVRSPMTRVRQTADALRLPCEVWEDLREVDFGRWEMRPFEEVSRISAPEDIDRWAKFDLDWSFPQGENLGNFVHRIKNVTEQVTQFDGKTVVVLTHGGVIRSMICHLLDLPHTKFTAFKIFFTSLTTIDVSEGFGALVTHNDTHHLDHLEDN